MGYTLGADGKYRPATRVSLPTNGDGRLPHELPGAGERDFIDLDDEEGILRAAAQIRQRRVAERLKEIQEKRQQSRPVRIKKRGGPVLHGDCLDLIPTLEDGSVSLVVTSPPYAEQRAGHYEGIPEEDYPDFMVQWMDALRPKLTPDGSVLIVIRPHLRGGVLSDYVLRTRLALRDAGWHECEELIWYKTEMPRRWGASCVPAGLGSRSSGSGSVLSRTATSKRAASSRKTWVSSGRSNSPTRASARRPGGIPCVASYGNGEGVARISDVILAHGRERKPGRGPPGGVPPSPCRATDQTFSQANDLVLDAFCGSGQTLLAAKGCGRRYLGIEREEKYVKIALGRLR